MKFVLSLFFIVLGLSGFAQPSPTEYVINSRVDVYNKDGSVRARGTVKYFIASGRYKIRFDGCFEQSDEILDVAVLKPAAEIQKTDSTLVPMFGKWKLHAYEYPNSLSSDTNSVVPLEIDADGKYIWYDVYNKPPIISAWIPYAKLNGVKTGADSVNGLIITDRYERYWKVYMDRDDHILVKRMCSNENREADRIK